MCASPRTCRRKTKLSGIGWRRQPRAYGHLGESFRPEGGIAPDAVYQVAPQLGRYTDEVLFGAVTVRIFFLILKKSKKKLY